MKSYVTYDGAGNLTGAYMQELHPDHASCFIEVSDEQRNEWILYRANADRTGIELAPPKPIDQQAETEVMCAEVDAAIAGIYAGPQRFIKEYEEREAQARDFIARDGADPVPSRIAAFATAAGMAPLPAAKLTVQQADNLRVALGQLADLRMRKYEIKRAQSLDEKQAVLLDILSKASVIAKLIG